MIAALETETPLFVIGWSHKYQEVLDQFELFEGYGIDYNKFDQIAFNIEKRLSSLSSDHEKIKKALPHIKELSKKQLVTVCSC
jgi:polysaccharide pyruvyl transferase WcaK-like protein